MRRRRIDIEATSCPFIDLNDSSCAKHFKLGRVDEAFSQCLGAYHGCPNYHRLLGDGRPIGVIQITVGGDLPIRAAG